MASRLPEHLATREAEAEANWVATDRDVLVLCGSLARAAALQVLCENKSILLNVADWRVLRAL